MTVTLGDRSGLAHECVRSAWKATQPHLAPAEEPKGTKTHQHLDNVDDPLGVLDTGGSRWADGTG
jgi:hypothetical protein